MTTMIETETEAPRLERYRSDLPYVIYLRVSRKGARDGDSYISPVVQERQCRKAAELYGLRVGEVIFDENRSGGSMDRPGIQRALQLIKDGKRAGLIVKRFDRFARKTSEALATLEAIGSLDAMLLSAEEGWQDLRGDGLIIVVMRAAMAEAERANRAKYLSESVDSAIARGVHLGEPFGYRKPHKGARLEIFEPEAQLVQRMFQMRADGKSWQAIANTLNAEGHRPRPHKCDGIVRQGQFRGRSLQQLVANPAYLGLAWNGKTRKPHEGAHDPIVAVELHERANRVKGTRTSSTHAPSLLSGLVRCACCGYVMRVEHDPAGKRVYRCKARSASTAGCAAPATCFADEIEAWASDQFEGDVFADEVWQAADDLDGVRAAEAALALAKRAHDRAARALAEFDSDDDDERAPFVDAVERARSTMREAKADLAEARRQAVGVDLPRDLDPTSWRTAPVEDRQQWISLVYGAIVVRRAERVVGGDRRLREPVADRVAALPIASTPRGRVAMIEHVRTLDELPAPAVAAV